jgi:hypothetical protein
MDRQALQLRLLLVLLPLLASLPLHAQDLAGFQDQDTCQSAIDAEIARGAKRIEIVENPVRKDFFGTVEFERMNNGTPAIIIYLCEGTKASGGRVISRLVHMVRHSELAARAEYERQKLAVEATFGPPCWDPSTPCDAQRDKLRQLGKTEATLSPVTVWRPAPRIFIDVNWGSAAAKDAARASRWNVGVLTHRRSILGTTDPQALSLLRMTTCQDDDPIGESSK